MESQQVVLQRIPTSSNNAFPNKRHFPIRLFSLFLLIIFSMGIYSWYEHCKQRMGNKKLIELNYYDLLDIIQYDNGNNMQQILLKYKLYKIAFVGYTQSNILIAICIVLTFPIVFNFIQKQSATTVVFFEFNLCSMYIQIIRVIVDYVHYFISSKCICLVSGTGAIWIHLLTKVTYYNGHRIVSSMSKITVIVMSYIIALGMIFLMDRLDILIGIILAIADIIFLEGGTIKFPKSVFQEKQEWAEFVRANKLPFWQDFVWNEYSANDRLCVDSIQFFVTRNDRMIMISRQ